MAKFPLPPAKVQAYADNNGVAPGEAPPSSKRSSSVKVMLHPDMHEKLRALADALGQAPATIASIAVSQYVLQQSRALGAAEKAVEGLIASAGPEMVQHFQKLSKGL
jgi:predicted transcriptional regulator